MSDQQNLLNLLEEIIAVPNNKILYSDVPYKIFIDEAESLHTRASIDLPLLTPYGLVPDKLNLLMGYTGALRTAQSNWEAKDSDKQKAILAWDTESPEMYELREFLIDHMDFAFRKDENLLKKIRDIKEGDSRPDTIQDLAILAVLGKENEALLTSINFDMAHCDRATELADRMGTLLGDINGRMYYDDEIKIIRDKAFTLTKELVDEIRSYGKFVFRKDEKLVKAYASKYHRERQIKYRKSKQESLSNNEV